MASSIDSCRPIVVAEDDDAIRELIRETLSGRGYDVHLAADGAQAIEEVHRLGVPTLLLVDLAMPVMDGPTLIRRLEAEAPGRHRVIVATAIPNAHRRLRAGSLVGVVQKPFSIAHLIELVGAHSQHEARSPAR